MDDTQKFFRDLKSQNERARRTINRLKRNSTKRNHKIWALCHYIQGNFDRECQYCPEWEHAKKYGPYQRMCYGLAEECLKIGSGEFPVDSKGHIIPKYISRTTKAANVNSKKVIIKRK